MKKKMLAATLLTSLLLLAEATPHQLWVHG